MGAWLDFNLSLPTQFDMERDRRLAAHMTRDQLAVLADMLIQRCYRSERITQQLLKRVGHLEVELAAAGGQDLEKFWSREGFQKMVKQKFEKI